MGVEIINELGQGPLKSVSNCLIIPDSGDLFLINVDYPVGRTLRRSNHKDESVSRSEYPSGVIWAVGLSGAGKTELISAMRTKLVTDFPNTILLDGDVIRAAIGASKNYSIASRLEQFEKMRRLAACFEKQNLIVLLGTVYFEQGQLDRNRAEFGDYVEIFVDEPLSALIKDDVKGLYGRARRGELSDVVGIDIPFTPPSRPDFVVSRQLGSPADNAAKIISEIPFLNRGLS